MILKQGPIELRNFQLSDAAKMAVLANNEKVSRNLRDGFPHPYTLQDAENFINRFLNQEPLTFFAIEYNGEYVGNISLMMGQDVYRKSAEVGYFIGEPYWNKGIVSVALKLITNYGFEKLDIVRIHTGVFEYNTASMKVLEKNGFEKDGVFKKSITKIGRIWDEHRYYKINPKYIDNK